jgi:CheY-like chemotaxis protein
MGHKPINILIVEDHADSATMLARLLYRSGKGYAPVAVGTCAMAIEAASNLRFDLLICDIMLPDGDGCELLAKLRAMYEGRPQICYRNSLRQSC